MVWNVSSFGPSILIKIWQLQDLDRNVWESLRKGLDYNEKSPEPVEPTIPEPAGEFDFGVMLEIFRIVGVIILVLLLVFVIVKIISGKRKKVIPESGSSDEGAVMIEAEMPVDVLWEAWQKAKAAGQYRESFRILYQIALKKLAEAGKILLHPEKTNWEYVTEIRDPLKSKEFADITVIYEMNWYGNSIPSESDFQKQHVAFLQFIEAFPDEK